MTTWKHIICCATSEKNQFNLRSQIFECIFTFLDDYSLIKCSTNINFFGGWGVKPLFLLFVCAL